MALTPFGKALRKLRIDRDMLLKEMAEKVEVSPAFLSAVESGRKSIPNSLLNRIMECLDLDSGARARLREAADESASSIRIAFPASLSPSDRSLATQLARNFDELDEEQKLQIQRIMDRRK